MKVFAWLAAATLLGAPRQVITFDSGPFGGVPAGWTLVATQRQPEARWEIRKDQSAPTPPYILAQVSASPDANRFPLAILDSLSMRDGDVSVRIKPVAGQTEQAAGLVFRYRDPRNFYLARFNALTNDVGVFKVVNGSYSALAPRGAPAGARGVHRVIPRHAWSIFKVSAKGARFAVYINHRRVLETDDGTFNTAGKVGLWTRADSVVYFDDFRASSR
jgi:hypothetical protein